jgi:hypothetical protein
MTPQNGLSRNFEEDIFINYDHDDNQVLMAPFKPWVDTMHESLGKRLTQLIGEKPKIWVDEQRLAGNDPLWETIVIRLSKTSCLVSVLSPSYVKSKYCREELNEFYDRAALNGGIKINNKSRIFKVVKTPIGKNDPNVDPLADSKLPIELRTLLQQSVGYNFFEIDEKGKLREFWPELGTEYQKKFLERLEDLAHDIKDFITCQLALPNDHRETIYLAETTPELCEDRNEIKRSLQQQNYHIVPDENLPFDAKLFEEKVLGYLQKSVLSIHLIGADQTSITAEDKREQSGFDLQQKHAAARVRKQHELAMIRGDSDPEYSRLIWIPTGLTPHEASYQGFIDYLQNDPAVYENAEVLRDSKLEDLKTILKKKLKFSDEQHHGNGGVKRVYLISDKQDKEAVKPLAAFLKEKYEVLLPFNEDGQVFSKHRENMRLCDAVLVFYGTVNTMEFKLTELRKIDALRDNNPLLAKGIYVAGPETAHKKEFTTDEAVVIKSFGEFSPELIKPFLDEFEKSASVAAGGVGR